MAWNRIGLPDSPRLHGTIDSLAIRFGNLFLPEYFRDGVESPPFEAHLEDVVVSMPDIAGEGWYDVTAETHVGELDAGVRVSRWAGADAPTIIYHHGAGEIPYDRGFNALFPAEADIEANLIAVRRPFHRSLGDFKGGIRTLSNVLAEQAVAVKLSERLVSQLRETGDGSVRISGQSMGGFVTNLHHIAYDSADRYVPLLAGLAEDDLFLDSVYATGVRSLTDEQVERLRELLNFEAAFERRQHEHVFPLLARYDRVVRFEPQRASYGDRSVQSIPKGHITGGVAVRALRNHVFDPH